MEGVLSGVMGTYGGNAAKAEAALNYYTRTLAGWLTFAFFASLCEERGALNF